MLEVFMKKTLCIALALLMCLMVTMPTFADDSSEIPPERADIASSFGLKQISGSTYRMWAKVINPELINVYAILTLYNSSYSPIASIYTNSSNLTINLSKYVTLSSGTYHLRFTYTADGATYSSEKTYTI